MKKILIICLLALSGCTTYNDLYMQDSTLTATMPQQTVVSNNPGWGWGGGWGGGGFYNQGWVGWNTWRPWWGGWGWNNGGCW